jgi:uracil-DNA glycosylase
MTVRGDAAAENIRRAAGDATTLAAVNALIPGCVACAALAAERTHTVPGDFPTGAQLMLVGEAPGAQEDAVGRPFVGKGGQLLDRLLEEAGIGRRSVAVANVVKCRPPGNRTPTRGEAVRCAGWLDRQMALVDPALVVTLGMTALTWALGPGHRIGDLRGRAIDWRGRRLVATYHPSAALRFGPNGAPMASLRDDLAYAAGMVRRP